jgi:RNA polymerase sigma-70 factor (ECF subfamily)
LILSAQGDRPEGAVMETLQLNDWLERWRAGDLLARDELVRAALPRLELLARKMLGRFPNVRPLNDTQDVLQNAVLRLLRSLQQVDPPPANTRAFFGLASVEIRRVLLDLARQQRTGDALEEQEPPDTRDAAEDLERWAAFHEAVERLPGEEREVTGLLFYHGWTQARVAELFQVSERTVARRWHSACLRLQALLNDTLPGEPRA